MASFTLARFALVASIPVALAACFVDASDHGHGGADQGNVAPGPGASSGGATTGTGQPSQFPILAKVDTDQTMQVSPGQGVGVFAEYVSGGHWHVWWTCDTNVNPQNASCAFDVKIATSTGTIANVTTQQFEPSTDAITTADQQLEATTTTSTGYDGLLFDAPAGATITLTATVGGLYDGRFLFFVENGQIDDGYQGTVTDPIQLAPTQP